MREPLALSQGPGASSPGPYPFRVPWMKRLALLGVLVGLGAYGGQRLSRSPAAREARARRALRRSGHRLRRSMWQGGSIEIGGYQILLDSPNLVVAGMRFELDLDDVEEWITGVVE